MEKTGNWEVLAVKVIGRLGVSTAANLVAALEVHPPAAGKEEM